MSSSGDENCPSQSCTPTSQLQLYQSIIFATPVLFALLLLILFCMLCIKRRRDALNSQNVAQLVSSSALHRPPLYEQGLSKSFRQMLPVIPFDEKFAAMSEDNQCPVCLGEYQLHEKLQQMPVCKHSFHVQCIDAWLSKNTTCPICRISLLHEGRKSMGFPLRPLQNRRWEERVVNEGQDTVRPDLSDGASSSNTGAMASPEAAPRFSAEHVVNIERI